MTTKNVLIVDDEPKVAFFLGKGLERSGHDYNIKVARSGEDALKIIDDAEIDLLVTDLRMPGINGLELIRWVKATSPDTRTILITAYGNDEVEAEARRLEAYRYITKPFDIGDFTDVVQQALGDVAVSQPGLTVLSDRTFDAITQQLDDLMRDVGARCIFLADMQGQCLAEVGYTEGLKTSTLLALLAGGFATTGELARQFGDGKAANLNFHQGSRYEIYSANVGDNLFISLLFNRKDQKSRIGLVWHFARRTIEALRKTLATAQDEAPAQSVGADFGSGVMAELDAMFGGGDDAENAERASSAPAEPAPAEFLAGVSAAADEQDIDAPTPGPSGPEPEAPPEAAFAASPAEPMAPVQERSNGKSAQSPPAPADDDQTGAQDGGLFSLEEAMELGLLPQEFDTG